jgi:hypothetical protein
MYKMKLTLQLLLLLLTITQVLKAQVCPTNFNNSQFNRELDYGGANDAALPYTYTFVPGAGTNRAIIVLVTYTQEIPGTPLNNIVNLNYGGQVLTRIDTRVVPLGVTMGVRSLRLSMFILREANIAAAMNNNMTVTFTNTNSIGGLAINTITLENVDQISPYENTEKPYSLVPSSYIEIPPGNEADAGDMILALGGASADNAIFTLSQVSPNNNLPNTSYILLTNDNLTNSHTHAFAYKKVTLVGDEQPAYNLAASTPRLAMLTAEINSSTTGNCLNLLPIRFKNVAVSKVANGNQLQFEVAHSVDNSYFIIERSYDGTLFKQIENIPSSTVNKYTYLDNTANSNVKTYYRVKEVLPSGYIYNSALVLVTPDADNQIYIFPNPAVNYLNISLNSELQRKKLQFKVVDMLGKTVISKAAGLNSATNTLDISKLQSGNYVLQIFDESNSIIQQQRFIKN